MLMDLDSKYIHAQNARLFAGSSSNQRSSAPNWNGRTVRSSSLPEENTPEMINSWSVSEDTFYYNFDVDPGLKIKRKYDVFDIDSEKYVGWGFEIKILPLRVNEFFVNYNSTLKEVSLSINLLKNKETQVVEFLIEREFHFFGFNLSGRSFHSKIVETEDGSFPNLNIDLSIQPKLVVDFEDHNKALIGFKKG